MTLCGYKSYTLKKLSWSRATWKWCYCWETQSKVHSSWLVSFSLRENKERFYKLEKGHFAIWKSAFKNWGPVRLGDIHSQYLFICPALHHVSDAESFPPLIITPPWLWVNGKPEWPNESCAQINHGGSDKSTAVVGVGGQSGVGEKEQQEPVLKYFCLVNRFNVWYLTTNSSTGGFAKDWETAT